MNTNLYTGDDLTLSYVDENFELFIRSMFPPVSNDAIVKKNERNMYMRFGNDYPYPDRIEDSKIPTVFVPMSFDFDFNSVTINEYLKGQTIDYHVDEGKESIYIISLFSDAQMYFKHIKDGTILTQALPRYSLYHLRDELRLYYAHSVTAENYRISVVFRKEQKDPIAVTSFSQIQL